MLSEHQCVTGVKRVDDADATLSVKYCCYKLLIAFLHFFFLFWETVEENEAGNWPCLCCDFWYDHALWPWVSLSAGGWKCSTALNLLMYVLSSLAEAHGRKMESYQRLYIYGKYFCTDNFQLSLDSVSLSRSFSYHPPTHSFSCKLIYGLLQNGSVFWFKGYLVELKLLFRSHMLRS